MSEKGQEYKKKRSLNWDEKKRQISPEKQQHYDGKADEAPRFDVNSVDDERKAKFFKILFFAIFFNILNLLCIGNLHQELRQFEKETDTTILTEYPGFFKAVQALFAFNLVQLIFFALLTYAMLRMQMTPFKIILVITGVIIFGKFISSISYLTAEKGVQKEFKEKILEITDSDIDSCLDDDAYKCRTIFTWNFSYYETILDIIFGTIFSCAMMYNQKKEKDELIKQALRIAPSSTENEKDLERAKPDSAEKNFNSDNQKLKKGENIYQRKRGGNKGKSDDDQLEVINALQKPVDNNLNINTDKNNSEMDDISDKLSLGGQNEKKQMILNRVVQIDDDEQNNQKLNEQLNSIHNETLPNDNNHQQLNESLNDSKIMMRNPLESSINISPDKPLTINEEQSSSQIQSESIQPMKASNIRGRKQIKKIKILQEKVLEDLDQNDNQDQQ